MNDVGQGAASGQDARQTRHRLGARAGTVWSSAVGRPAGKRPRGVVSAFFACKKRRTPAISELRVTRLLWFCGGPLTRGRLLFRVAFSSIGWFWAPSPYAWAGSRTTDCPSPHLGFVLCLQPYLAAVFLWFGLSGIGTPTADRGTRAAELLSAYRLVGCPASSHDVERVVLIDDVRPLRVHSWQVVAIGPANRDPKPFVWTADPKRVLAAVKRGKQFVGVDPLETICCRTDPSQLFSVLVFTSGPAKCWIGSGARAIFHMGFTAEE